MRAGTEGNGIVSGKLHKSKIAMVTRRQGMSDGTWRIQIMKYGDGKSEDDWETVFMSHSEDDVRRFEINMHNEISPDMTDEKRPTNPRRKLEL